jgi:hypothetical protein
MNIKEITGLNNPFLARMAKKYSFWCRLRRPDGIDVQKYDREHTDVQLTRVPMHHHVYWGFSTDKARIDFVKEFGAEDVVLGDQP